MFDPAHIDLSRPHTLAIIEAIKKSSGITVADLARALDMSYMGIKQHCLRLEEHGYLKTWRVPRKKVGRPEKLYLLTEKCDGLFPQPGGDFAMRLLEAVKLFFGEASPERLLIHYFEGLRDEWAPIVKKGKSLVEKATRLADLRDKMGSFSRCKYDSVNGFRIEEYHHPLQDIFEKYPGMVRIELRMMEQLLGSKVHRKVQEQEKGGQLVVYEIRTLG